MTYENILWDVQDGVGTLTFNRPKVLNALNARTFEELAQLMGEIEADPAIRALVLTGAGDKAFVAGADISAMSVMDRSRRGASRRPRTGCSSGSSACRSRPSPR